MKEFFKKIYVYLQSVRKKIARTIVTMYANYVYKQAVSLAEAKRKMVKAQVFVVTSYEDGKSLLCITKNEFLKIRHALGIPSDKLPISALKTGCFYYTSQANDKGAITDKAKELRRLAFILDRLRQAKLA